MFLQPMKKEDIPPMTLMSMWNQVRNAATQGVQGGFAKVGETIQKTPLLKLGVNVLNAADYGLGTVAKTTEGLLTDRVNTLKNLQYQPGEGLKSYANRNVTDISPYVTQKVAGTQFGQKFPMVAPILGLGAGMLTPSPSDALKVGKFATQAGDVAKFSDEATDLVKPSMLDPLTSEAKKYKRTINIQDNTDLRYLERILSKDQIDDIRNGKMTNWKGKSYEDVAGVNIISETPKTIEQQLNGKIKEIQLNSDTFYHGTSQENATSILKSGFKKGSELPESNFRGGGYGKMQSSISFAETPKEASRFSTLSENGEIVEAKLKPGAKVVTIDGVEDAIDIEDYLDYLKQQKIDAVYIGGGEKELVVINPKSITPTKSQLTDIWNKAQGK